MRNILQIKVGLRIKDLRAVHDVSQERFANKIGMDRTYLASIEVGQRKGYRTECVSAPIIHCRCSAGMWNSLQTIPEPYSSGALSFRLRLLEADANNPST